MSELIIFYLRKRFWILVGEEGELPLKEAQSSFHFISALNFVDKVTLKLDYLGV